MTETADRQTLLIVHDHYVPLKRHVPDLSHR